MCVDSESQSKKMLLELFSPYLVYLSSQNITLISAVGRFG